MEELKKYIENIQANCIKLADADKSKAKGCEAILTATTLIIMKINEIKERDN